MTRKPATDFKAATRRMYYNLKRRDARCKMTLAEFREWVNGWRVGERDVWRCRYCQDFLVIGELTADHSLPLSLGGPSEPTNLYPSCVRCNEAKGPLTDTEFVRILRVLRLERPEAKAYILRKLRSPERWYGAHKKRQAAKAKLAGVSQGKYWKGM